MTIAVLSGKGGAGKTFVASNLAWVANGAVYVDCDVEEPNGRIFLKPEEVRSTTVTRLLPSFSPEDCTQCRTCVDYCRFHALAFWKGQPHLFPEVCHSCGGCALFCPSGAIRELPNPVGTVEQGKQGALTIITGILDVGQASGVPVIRAAIQAAQEAPEELVILDCPPGSACSVTECVSHCSFCLLTAEPTAFGFHNFVMVHHLAQVLEKPCAVVINKAEAPYGPLEDYCKANCLPILARIPAHPRFASLCAQGQLASQVDVEAKALFQGLLQSLQEVIP